MTCTNEDHQFSTTKVTEEGITPDDYARLVNADNYVRESLIPNRRERRALASNEDDATLQQRNLGKTIRLTTNIEMHTPGALDANEASQMKVEFTRGGAGLINVDDGTVNPTKYGNVPHWQVLTRRAGITHRLP